MRINQSTPFLKGLCQYVAQGKLVPAGFQRPYVWSQDDVMALVTSIMKGYPLGAFLTWTPGPKGNVTSYARNRLGPVQFDQEDKWAGLLLDGQNRLASLMWMYHDMDAGVPPDATELELAVWNPAQRLVVNLEERKFEFVAVGEASEKMRLPMSHLLDGPLFNRRIRELEKTTWAAYSHAEIDEAMKWAQDCQDSFRDARVVLSDIEGGTATDAKEAFLHICKVGVPMSVEDLERAFTAIV